MYYPVTTPGEACEIIFNVLDQLEVIAKDQLIIKPDEAETIIDNLGLVTDFLREGEILELY